ncbi:MAG: DUF2911 domain-containing protein [Crocinitomicaceae bacterium]
MKKLLVGITLFASTGLMAQISAPQMSPSAKMEQTVGLTNITVEYSRPSKRDRVVFGDLVPMNEMWRTGANKNTIITTSDVLIFGKDTLKAGTYALFTKPTSSEWAIYFYTATENWGTPEEWNAENVALEVKVKSQALNDVVETFTIGIESVSMNDAVLALSWDKTKVAAKFTVATKAQVNASIKKVMAGPSANDYYRAADYKYSEKEDLKQALEWINKSVEMSGAEAPFYVLRKKALLQAELGDKKGAIATAKLSLEGAKKAGYDAYIKANEESIKEWSAK